MAGLAAVVAAAGRAGTADAEGRAVSLDVAETLAVIALLGLSAARKRAFARLVVCRGTLENHHIGLPIRGGENRTGLLACVTVLVLVQNTGRDEEMEVCSLQL